MNIPLASPGKPQDSRARNLAAQERQRVKALQRLDRLRREASEQIDKLIAFIDATDEYAQTECELNGDEQDQAYREGNSIHLGAHWMEDDEDSDHGEDDDPAEESEASGMGDLDGVLEQYGRHYAAHGEAI